MEKYATSSEVDKPCIYLALTLSISSVFPYKIRRSTLPRGLQRQSRGRHRRRELGGWAARALCGDPRACPAHAGTTRAVRARHPRISITRDSWYWRMFGVQFTCVGLYMQTSLAQTNSSINMALDMPSFKIKRFDDVFDRFE